MALEPYDEARVIVLHDADALKQTLESTVKEAQKGPVEHKGKGVTAEDDKRKQAEKAEKEKKEKEEKEEVEKGGKQGSVQQGAEAGKSKEAQLQEGSGPGQSGAGVQSQVR